MSDLGKDIDARQVDSEIIKKFRRAVNESYDVLAKMGIGDREGLDELGALGMAHQQLKNSAPSQGFSRLWEMGRLNLSVEALTLRPEFNDLFSPDERKVARDRLEQKGYEDLR